MEINVILDKFSIRYNKLFWIKNNSPVFLGNIAELRNNSGILKKGIIQGEINIVSINFH